MKHKFTVLDEHFNERHYDYGNIYQIEETSTGNRLKIGPSNNQIALLLKLADCLDPPYYILYVLIVTRTGQEYGRYESPEIDTPKELSAFFDEYKDFLETDGRHHIWIGTIDHSGLLVYDQHNVIFAYGDLDKYIRILKDAHFTENDFDFPDNHCHHFHAENDISGEQILKHWHWEIYPLAENDEYD